jgi:mannosyltransferase
MSAVTPDRLPFWRPDTRSAVLLFCAVFAVGLVARFYGIGSMPFWLDEVTTVTRSSLPFSGMVTDSLSHHHLPSYFVITSALGRLGLTEAVLRMPSAIFGAASCAMLFLIGRALGGWRAGLVAGMLLALSPLQVQYGQEARSYTFVILMMTVGLLGLVQLARDPAAASAPWRGRATGLTPWILYTIGTIAALNVLSIAFFWLISANLAAIVIALDDRVDRRRFVIRWMTAQAIVLLLTLPWFGAMAVATHGKMANATDWVPAVTVKSFVSTLKSLYFMRSSRLINFHLFPAAIPGFGILILLLAAMGLITLRGRAAGETRRWTLLLALAIIAIVPPLTILGISAIKPLWMPRYLIWSALPFLLFVGLGINLLPRRWRSAGAFAVVLLGLVNLAPYYRTETKPRWDLAAVALRQVMEPGDILLVPDRGPITMMDFFLGRQGDALPDGSWTTDVFKAAQRLSAGGRVWAVYGNVGQADHTTAKSFARIIQPLGHSIGEIREGDLITMRLFATPSLVASNLP